MPKLFREPKGTAIKKSMGELVDKYIVPNSVLQGVVSSVEFAQDEHGTTRKMKRIRVKLEKFKSLAHSSKNLYKPYPRHGYIYDDGGFSSREGLDRRGFQRLVSGLVEFSDQLFRDLFGTIEESRHIYDTKMPHFAHEVDSLPH